MMVFQVFIVAAAVSFLGSIPPGTLNILVLQLSLEKKLYAALRFALAVALVEYPYVWIATQFEQMITSSTIVQQNFKLLGATVMTAIGIFSLWSSRNPSTFSGRFQNSGFRRGLVLSILNPQAIPWWIGMTAYLKAEGWISLETSLQLHSYLLGTAIGSLILLILISILANRISSKFQQSKVIRLLPGVILLGLGLIAMIDYFLI
ncbi:MAG: LysE family transporter [Bacteroidetes bacterium]|nr:LysE family transporter [Bacteroidota bacterium]